MAGHSWYATESAKALRALGDDALLFSLSTHAADERDSAADIVEHLMEIDRRGLAIERGYSSLFVYCRQALGYSEQAAYLRIRAARTAADSPEIVGHLRAGRLHLEAIARIAPYLTASNAEELIRRATGASKREILALIAPLSTEAAPRRDVVTPATADIPSSNAESGCKQVELVPRLRQRFHFTADGDLLLVVERLRALLKHKYPDGRLESIFREASEALLDRIDPCRRPASKSRRSRGTASRIVPNSVKALVWKRDGGRCAYVSPEGHRCGSDEALEYDHVVAWADGGRSDTPENIRLLCRAHNLWLGRKRFGERRRES